MKILISFLLAFSFSAWPQINGQEREYLEYEVYFAIQKKLKQKYKHMSKEELHEATMTILEEKKRAKEDNDYYEGKEDSDVPVEEY